MKNTLFLISNEKIFQNNEMFFCDNLDMKSTPEGLNKHFDVKIIARKSKVNRLLKLNLRTIKTFSNILSYVLEVIKSSKHNNSQFLIISLNPGSNIGIFDKSLSFHAFILLRLRSTTLISIFGHLSAMTDIVGPPT